MSITSWLLTLNGRRTASANNNQLHQTRFRPKVELLEDRVVPATLIVNSILDNTTDISALTLRDAITLVNNAGRPASLGQPSMPAGWTSQIDTTNPFGSSDTIEFSSAVSGQTAVLNGSELPQITADISINGPGASQLTISGNQTSRVFDIDTGAVVSISGLTISNGSEVFGSGGGIANFGTLTVRNSALSANSAGPDEYFFGGGGGIYNIGNLRLCNCTLSGDYAYNGAGGGIFNYGAVTVSDSTVSGNSADQGGGGIMNDGVLTVSNSTISGNSGGCGGGGGGIVNYDTLTVTNSTLMGNSASSSGGGIANYGPLVVSNSTLSGNSASGGGGIYNSNYEYLGTLTVSNSTISDNSASVAGGGIYNGAPETLTVNLDSAVYANQAPSGIDLENLGTLSIDQSALASVDNQNPGATTINVAATDTAIGLTASVNPSVAGQIVFSVQVLAAQAGAGMPTGSVTLYDGSNNALGTEPLDANGQASFAALVIVGSQSPIHAVYYNDGYSNFTGSASASLIQAVNALTPDNLQPVVNSLAASPAAAVELQVGDDASWQAALAAINAVTAPLLNGVPVPVTIVLSVGPGTYTDMTYGNTDPNVYFILNGSAIPGGTTVNGHSPALVVTGGNVTIVNITFTTATDSPTILVSGGYLTLGHDIVQESTGFSDAAIAVSGGGTVNLGTAASPGGNTINVNGAGELTDNTSSNPITAVGDTFTVNSIPQAPSSLSGTVFTDFNDDGQIDFGETGIAGVAIALTGTDDLGHMVSLCQTTDGDGAYVFLNLRPGNYQITETQPAGYPQGIDTVGTAGGSLVATDQFFVQLAQGVDGLNYNFGEQPPTTGAVKKGQAAGIGFWNNKNGQALILALNGGTGHQLGDWLAATMPNTFGASAGSNNLTGKSNAFVAALFQQDFLMKGVKLDAQVLATALSVYVTDSTLDSTGIATHYGFTVSGAGLGTDTVNVGSSGDAFGVANNTVMTVLDLLVAADAQAVNGVLYNGNVIKRNEANSLFSALNEAGGIS